VLRFRNATTSDLDLLRRWDEQPHVVESDPNDDWGWEVELARTPAWREQLIAEEDGRPIGFVEIIDPALEDDHYWGECPRDLRAIDIWIGEPSDLGRGYGTQMMRLALDRCFAVPSVSAVVIDPLASNVRARRFYERLGFELVGERQFGADLCAVYRLVRDRWMAHGYSRDMTSSREHRPLGTSGLTVFPLALGCMGMSGMYGPADERESIATIHAALDAGVSLIDTGDFYGNGHNEMLIARALQGRREKALLSVKFGALRSPEGGWLGFDARPAAVKNFLAYTLTRLGVDHVDIYRPARLDPAVPIEDTVGAIADLVKAGYVRHVGLSEVGADTVRRAHAVHPICDLQIEYSLVSRGPEAKIFPELTALGVGVTAYGALSRGLLSGSKPADRGDFRAYLPRFAGENRERNQRVVEKLQELAAEKHVTPSQLAIAWVLSKGESIVPVIGARTRRQLEESLGALAVALSPGDVARLEEAIPASAIAGSRYDEHQMRILDSERG
jgi:aryl-alcohol dehydrogenase-like predicted oxidoreductase/RimJ/RimL family protein N-acetyltransferase